MVGRSTHSGKRRVQNENNPYTVTNDEAGTGGGDWTVQWQGLPKTAVLIHFLRAVSNLIYQELSVCLSTALFCAYLGATVANIFSVVSVFWCLVLFLSNSGSTK